MIARSFDLSPEHTKYMHIYYISLLLCVCSHGGGCEGVVRGELAELVVSFHHVVSGDGIQFTRLGGKHVYPLGFFVALNSRLALWHYLQGVILNGHRQAGTFTGRRNKWLH